MHHAMTMVSSADCGAYEGWAVDDPSRPRARSATWSGEYLAKIRGVPRIIARERVCSGGLRDRRLRYLHAMQPYPSATAPASLSALAAWQLREGRPDHGCFTRSSRSGDQLDDSNCTHSGQPRLTLTCQDGSSKRQQPQCLYMPLIAPK